jgi:hypothetical protein
MAKTRLETIEEIGLRAYEAGGATPAKSMIKAFAAMIAEAIRRPSAEAPKAKRVDLTKLPYGPGEVFDELERQCADIIQLRPYEVTSFGRLGKAMARIQGLEKDDLYRVSSWIAAGGLKTWTITPTWNHVVKHYPNWVMYARNWEAKGGSLASGGLNGADSWRLG